MTTDAISGLFLQGFSLAVIGITFRRAPFERVGFLFACSVFLYHGASEILARLTSRFNEYRELAAAQAIDGYILLVGLVLLAFSVTYCMCTKYPSPLRFRRQVLDRLRLFLNERRWPIFLLSVLSFSAFQYVRLQETEVLQEANVYEGYWALSLSRATWMHFLLLAGLALVLARRRRFSPTEVCLGLCAVLSTLGSRSGLVLPLAVFVVSLGALGIKLTRRSLFVVATYGLLFILAVATTRALVGRRSVLDATPIQRVSMYCQSLVDGLHNRSVQTGKVESRLDANTMGGFMLAELNRGAPPTWFATWVNDVYMVVPRAVMPSKIERNVTDRNAEGYLIEHYRVHPTDYCTGWMGLLVGSFGKGGSILAGIVLGFCLAKLDDWFVRSTRMAAFFVHYVALQVAIWYEGLFSHLLATIRNFLIVYAAIVAVGYLFQRRTKPAFSPKSPGNLAAGT